MVLWFLLKPLKCTKKNFFIYFFEAQGQKPSFYSNHKISWYGSSQVYKFDRRLCRILEHSFLLGFRCFLRKGFTIFEIPRGWRTYTSPNKSQTCRWVTAISSTWELFRPLSLQNYKAHSTDYAALINTYKDQWNEGFLFLLRKNKGISVSNEYYIIYNYTFTTFGWIPGENNRGDSRWRHKNLKRRNVLVRF